MNSVIIKITEGKKQKILIFDSACLSNKMNGLSKSKAISKTIDDQSKFQFCFIIIILILFMLSFNVRAQINSHQLDNDEVSTLVLKLKDKVLLNESQVALVKQFMQKYSTDLQKINTATKGNNTKQEFVKSTNRQIISILDDRQKMKFEIVENEWWQLVRSEEND